MDAEVSLIRQGSSYKPVEAVWAGRFAGAAEEPIKPDDYRIHDIHVKDGAFYMIGNGINPPANFGNLACVFFPLP